MDYDGFLRIITIKKDKKELPLTGIDIILAETYSEICKTYKLMLFARKTNG